MDGGLGPVDRGLRPGVWAMDRRLRPMGRRVAALGRATGPLGPVDRRLRADGRFAPLRGAAGVTALRLADHGRLPAAAARVAAAAVAGRLREGVPGTGDGQGEG